MRVAATAHGAFFAGSAMLLSLLLISCSPGQVGDRRAVPSPSPSPSPLASASEQPLDWLPANVTFAGWITISEIESVETAVAKIVMGSPPLFEGRGVRLRAVRLLQDVRVGECLFVVFRARPDGDGTHQLVTLERRSAGAPPGCGA